MAQTNLNIRIDEKLKKDFDALCDDIGMSMTTAICIFAKKAVKEQRIPFELTANNDPFYSSENRERLLRSAQQMEQTGGTIHDIKVNEDD